MNSGLGVACVTAVLKSLLENCLVQHGLSATLGDAQVSALPPDRVPIGADERSQLNLFLYRLTPNTGWRSGARHKAGLSLDLHYLVTAYGEQDFVAEILLGHAMQVLHGTGTLDGDAIQAALALVAPNGSATILSPGRAALAAAHGLEIVDEISIAPEFLGTEELSRIWSALQARYRPSATYKVSAAWIRPDA